MDEKTYFTYVVASWSLTLYIGMTGDLQKRVLEYKHRLHEGFCATYNCNRLVWSVRFVDPSIAIAREKQFKGMDSREEDRVDRQSQCHLD